MPPVPLATHSYRARSLPLSAQRLVNLYPEAAPREAANVVGLFGAPGLKPFGTAGSGPTRGLHRMKGVLYMVSGRALYSVASNGTGTLIGAIPGSGPVDMDDNGTQLVIVTDPDAYVYNRTTGVLAQITDPDFPGASTCAFLDSYIVFSRPGTGRFFISALGDATAFDALDFATAEASPDDIVSVFVEKRQLFLLGEFTTEVWFNSGASPFPIERLPGGVIERGCLAPLSPVKEDNSLFWLGHDGVIWRADGLVPTRISTHPIEKAISGFADKSVRAFTYALEGHVNLVFRFAEKTFVHDITTGRWHERETYPGQTWDACCGVRAYGKQLAGSASSGNLYQLDLDTHAENGTTLQRIMTFPPIGDGERDRIMSRFQVDFEMGVGVTSGQGADPQAMLRFSDDGGRTWSNEIWRSIGKIGETDHRAEWRRLGQFRRRVMEVTVADPVKFAVVNAYAA